MQRQAFGWVGEERPYYAQKLRGQAIGTWLLIVAFVIPQVGAGEGAAVSRLTEQEQRDSYAIYSMLLKLDEWRVHSPILGIEQETRIFQPVAGVGEPACVWPQPSADEEGIYGPLIEDFKRRNGGPLVLQEKFDVPSYRLLTGREVEEIGKKYPVVPPPSGAPGRTQQDARLSGINVVFFLSALGFSADHERALAYIATWNGGRYYFLLRTEGKWAIDKNYRGSVCSWVV